MQNSTFSHTPDHKRINKKHLKNVGPIHYCEPSHAHSPGVASGTVARRLRIDVHDANDNDDNDNARQRDRYSPMEWAQLRSRSALAYRLPIDLSSNVPISTFCCTYDDNPPTLEPTGRRTGHYVICSQHQHDMLMRRVALKTPHM